MTKGGWWCDYPNPASWGIVSVLDDSVPLVLWSVAMLCALYVVDWKVRSWRWLWEMEIQAHLTFNTANTAQGKLLVVLSGGIKYYLLPFIIVIMKAGTELGSSSCLLLCWLSWATWWPRPIPTKSYDDDSLHGNKTKIVQGWVLLFGVHHRLNKRALHYICRKPNSASAVCFFISSSFLASALWQAQIRWHTLSWHMATNQ